MSKTPAPGGRTAPGRVNFRVILLGAAVAGAAAGPGLAQSDDKQPPMNDFYQAFYTCTNGGAFMMSYDDEIPTKAEMVTSNDNRHYKMTRTESDKGVEFRGDGARFWTDGRTVVVQGTRAPYSGCRTKAS